MNYPKVRGQIQLQKLLMKKTTPRRVMSTPTFQIIKRKQENNELPAIKLWTSHRLNQCLSQWIIDQMVPSNQSAWKISRIWVSGLNRLTSVWKHVRTERQNWSREPSSKKFLRLKKTRLKKTGRNKLNSKSSVRTFCRKSKSNLKWGSVRWSQK